MHTTGLTLGKFAPLHKGHEHLIQTACSQVDSLICLIYDSPEVTTIPLETRSRWLRTLFPTVEVIELRGAPQEVGETPEIKRRHEDFILGVLGGRKITHFFCSEFYGEHMSQALGALNCLVDPARNTVPISGTAIRESPFLHRERLSPLVYRDLITHVVLLGAPSTGKTTLAEALAQRFQTTWMPEYGREYWEQHQSERRLSLEQLVELAEGHWEREERKLQEANGYLFTDTNALTTYQFSLYYHGTVHPQLVEYASRCNDRYDLVLVCDTDIPYDDTWDRSGETNRQEFQEQILADLEARSIAYTLLQGSLEQRIATVEQVLGRLPRKP
ncbi:AAA family ATPase [Armatimonas rosea]|uniref:NadR type nicotinamide-nucleotide adenylyltransferase n=1 Tax=Armatimonas rosea TaxID=685828 RepID=A0A7W9SPE5_ARMRO|nr:AAA family ATPase [Armatimonas rosea]MBB6050035.1 NadR type nicotinamide-nucleotide adenylyltransferase [Armatimonas rosea]